MRDLPPLPKGSSAADWGGRDTGPCLYRDDEVLTYVRAAVAAAVAAEREACAQLCDVTPPYPFRPSIEAAHAIRARRFGDPA